MGWSVSIRFNLSVWLLSLPFAHIKRWTRMKQSFPGGWLYRYVIRAGASGWSADALSCSTSIWKRASADNPFPVSPPDDGSCHADEGSIWRVTREASAGEASPAKARIVGIITAVLHSSCTSFKCAVYLIVGEIINNGAKVRRGREKTPLNYS